MRGAGHQGHPEGKRITQDFKSRQEYFDWKKRRNEKIKEGEKVSFPKFRRLAPLLTMIPKPFLYFVLVGFIGIGLLLWTPLHHSPKEEIRKAPLPLIPPKTYNPIWRNLSARMEDGQPIANSTFSPDEIMARAKRAVFSLRTAQGSGTAFLVSSPGVIVTHARGIGRNDEAEVLIPSLGMRRAVVLKKLTDPLDLVFLKVEGTDLESEPLQNSNSCREGEEVMEIGFPFPEKSGEPTLTRGIMRNCNGLYQGVRYLQVDQGGSPESIGSPLINSKGEVIAISKGKLAVDQEEMNVGLPIRVVQGVMQDKLAYLEEKIKEREKFYKYVYDDFWVTASREYERYQKNLTLLYTEGKLSAEEAYVLEKNPLTPPAGFSSLKDWIADLAERVRNEEMTRERAIASIKGHFDLSYPEKSL